MEPIVRKVVNEHADTVRLVIKHHWLPAHAHARLAAQVSVAADLQGKFWPVHEMLLDRHFASGKDGATIEGFVPYLRTIPGLDVARLVREVNSPEVNARVDRELKEFKSTPEFVLNGRFFQGQVSEAQLELLIEEASH
jgi:protein-disulfide isomerase